MDKRQPAIDCYIQSLQKSVYQTEALDALFQHEMLMVWEERDLLDHIYPLEKPENEADLKILKHLYEGRCKNYYRATVSRELLINSQLPYRITHTNPLLLSFPAAARCRYQDAQQCQPHEFDQSENEEE